MDKWLVAFALLAVATTGLAGEEPALKSVKDKASYAIGLSIGRSMKQDHADLDPDMIARGMKDALAGAKPLMTDEEIGEALTAFQKDMQTRRTESRKAEAEKAKAEGQAFLAENGKKQGVVTLPSGLQYKVIKNGLGRVKPKATDTVLTHYVGTLLDGTEFDSSLKRGEPAEFQVDEVIPAWTEALQLMKVGDKWQLFVPPNLGYGEKGAGRLIGPNATLIFEVELLEIKKAEKAK